MSRLHLQIVDRVHVCLDHLFNVHVIALSLTSQLLYTCFAGRSIGSSSGYRTFTIWRRVTNDGWNSHSEVLCRWLALWQQNLMICHLACRVGTSDTSFVVKSVAVLDRLIYGDTHVWLDLGCGRPLGRNSGYRVLLLPDELGLSRLCTVGRVFGGRLVNSFHCLLDYI